MRHWVNWTTRRCTDSITRHWVNWTTRRCTDSITRHWVNWTMGHCIEQPMYFRSSTAMTLRMLPIVYCQQCGCYHMCWSSVWYFFVQRWCGQTRKTVNMIRLKINWRKTPRWWRTFDYRVFDESLICLYITYLTGRMCVIYTFLMLFCFCSHFVWFTFYI